LIRLVVLDVDGTLVGTRSQVSEETVAVLRAAIEAGVYVTLATARSFESASRLAERLGLNAPLIVHAGVLVKDPTTGVTVFECPLPLECALAIVNFCDEHELELSVPLGGRSYSRLRNPPQPVPAHVLMPERIAPYITAGPMSLWVQGHDEIDRVCERFEAEYRGIVRFSLAYNGDGTPVLALTAAAANKGNALAALCQALQIGPEETMAVGDADVDLPMFEVAGLAVAMGNADEAVQRAATVVVPNVDDVGAAWAIQQFVLADQPDGRSLAPRRF